MEDKRYDRGDGAGDFRQKNATIRTSSKAFLSACQVRYAPGAYASNVIQHAVIALCDAIDSERREMDDLGFLREVDETACKIACTELEKIAVLMKEMIEARTKP